MCVSVYLHLFPIVSVFSTDLGCHLVFVPILLVVNLSFSQILRIFCFMREKTWNTQLTLGISSKAAIITHKNYLTGCLANNFRNFSKMTSKFRCGFRKSCCAQQCLLMVLEILKETIDKNKAFGALLTVLSIWMSLQEYWKARIKCPTNAFTLLIKTIPSMNVPRNWGSLERFMSNLLYACHNSKFSSRGSSPQLISKYDNYGKFSKS